MQLQGIENLRKIRVDGNKCVMDDMKHHFHPLGAGRREATAVLTEPIHLNYSLEGCR